MTTLKEIQKQSEFCLELMKRLNEDVKASSHPIYYCLDKYTQMMSDTIRLRRELNKLRLLLGEPIK